MSPVRELTQLHQTIYAAVNSVIPQILHKTWVELENRLDISPATNGSHIEVFGI